jgi:hypothetical protein
MVGVRKYYVKLDEKMEIGNGEETRLSERLLFMLHHRPLFKTVFAMN